MNVIISKRATAEVIARYEIHLATNGGSPSDQEYFDDAWRKAVTDRLVDARQRRDYMFQLQRPKTLYESSR